MEKAYRDYGHDIDNTDTPLESGSASPSVVDKPDGFLGKEAWSRRRTPACSTRGWCRSWLTDPEPFLFHGEPAPATARPVG